MVKNPEQNLVIAIDGPAGGGKSELSKRIADEFGLDFESQVIHSDHYFEPVELGGDAVMGMPAGFNSGRFMREIGDPVNTGGDIDIHEYRFTTGEYHDRPHPDRRDLIVVEGIKILGLPIDWDVKIWVNTPRAVREQRFLDRPVTDRRSLITDQDVLKARFELWADDADAYEASLDPHGRADILIIDGTTPAQQQLLILAEALVTAARI